MTSDEFKNKILKAYGAMMDSAFSILGNKEESEDLVQEVIKDLWTKHEKLKISGDPLPYVLKCVQNRCLDSLRKKKIFINIQDISLNTDLHAEFYEKEDVNALIQALYEAILYLKEPAKTVINLNLKGKSIDEIAETLQLTNENTRKILSRTRLKLKKILNERK